MSDEKRYTITDKGREALRNTEIGNRRYTITDKGRRALKEAPKQQGAGKAGK
jgi:DNA-binding PadR family transcriptional regulator